MPITHPDPTPDCGRKPDNDVMTALCRARLVAIVRGRDREASLRTVLTLVEQGIDLVEVSLSGADALGVLERAREAVGRHVWLGAGAVAAAADVRRAADAGADFVVTTRPGAGVAEAVARNMPAVAGASTPEEVRQADRAGARALRVVPGSVGGTAHVRALRTEFPRHLFIPVGAATPAEAVAYLAAGACAVGLGHPVVRDAADGGDLHALRARVARFRAACTA